jgi:uncharacterized protein YjiS (DUF1127 family)
MSIVNLFISVGRAFSDWRRRQRAYGELMALDDRSLADIGIRREQIRALLDGGDVRGRDMEPVAVPAASNFWSAQGQSSGLWTKPNS